MDPSSNLSEKYFAAAKPQDIGSAIVSRLQRTGLWRNASGIRANYEQAHRNSYASVDMGAGSASRVERGGDQGELSKVKVNRARSTQKALLGLLLSQKIGWRPTARNGSVGARAAIQKASNLLEWLWKQRGVETVVSRWVDQGLRYSEAFVFAEWDWQKGPSASGGKKQGDLTFHNVLPWHVFRDDAFNDASALPWLCVRTFVSKWELAALYPVDILGQPTVDRLGSVGTGGDAQLLYDGVSLLPQTDVTPLYHFFHRDSAAVPGGKQTVFTSPTCVLKDGPLLPAYGRIPVLRFAPEELDDTIHGYTAYFDTLGLQEEIDGIETAIASNLLTFATQAISMEEGTEAQPDRLAGLKVFYRKPGRPAPEALQLTAIPKDAFEHLDRLNAAQRDIMGLNDVAMGQPETAQMNAQAFAILAGMAQQRNAPVQLNVVKAVGELGALSLDTMKRQVSETRQVAIAGKSAETFVDLDFIGSDLEPIDDVLVGVGSGLEQSVAGRYQLGQMQVEMGIVKTAEQLQQVMETGRLEPATDPVRDAVLLVAAENDALSRGEQQVVHFCDDHLLHAKNHNAVLSNPTMRGQVEVVEAVHAHLDAHYVEFWGLPPGVQPRTDPQYPVRMRMLLGQQPPPMAPEVPPGDAGGAPPSAAPGAMAALAPPGAPAPAPS